LVLNRVRVLGSRPHNPTQLFWEYPQKVRAFFDLFVCLNEHDVTCSQNAAPAFLRLAFKGKINVSVNEIAIKFAISRTV